jgi:nucleoside-diphosphate-sugar epimerase
MTDHETERSSKKVVVFGGAGYLGSVLTGQLLERGYQVKVFDSLRFGKESLAAYEGHPGFSLAVGDIRDIGAVTGSIQGAYACMLLAALVGEPACDLDPKETVDVNLIATKAVAEACRHYQVPRFFFASTDSAYGIQEGIMVEDAPLNPISLYARLKAQVEAEILGLGNGDFRPIILRMATIYGYSPRMRFDLIINILTLHAFTKGKITIFGGKQWRPLVHVADAARAYVLSLEAPLGAVGGQIFNVGSNGQNYQVGELGELVRQVFPEVHIETVPQTPDLRDYHVSFDKITKYLGYQVQCSVADGIREIRRAFESGSIKDHQDPRYYNVPRRQG